MSRQMLRILAGVSTAWIAAGTCVGRTTAQAQAPATQTLASSVGVDALFAEYRARRFDEVTSGLARVENWTAFVDAVDERLGDWPADWAEAFALETARAMLEASSYDVGRTGNLPVRLVQDAYERLRQSHPPSRFERQWVLARYAVQHGVAPELPSPLSVDWNFTERVRERFPRDQRIKFAGVVSEERFIGDWLYTVGVEVARPLSLNRRLANEAGHAFMEHLAEEYGALAHASGVGAEAQLRAGYLLLVGGAPERALDWLDGVRDVNDRWVVYLAHLFRGRALAELERYDEAAAAQRAALRVWPGAQSAHRSLVAALYLAGRQDDSATEARRLLSMEADLRDPWFWYPYGLFRSIDDYTERMREALP